MRFISKHTVTPARLRGIGLIAFVGVLALVAGAAAVSGDETVKKSTTPTVGTALGNLAPDFTADNVHGGKVTLADHRGKVVLLDFWASWCGPCMREMPTLVTIKDRYPADKFVIIGVSLDMEKTEARMHEAIKQNKLDYPIAYDGKGWRNAVAALYGVRSIPATYVLNADGLIVGKDKRGNDLVRLLDKLVARE